MINIKVRIKNKVFWLALIPAVLLAIKAIAEVFGVTIDVSILSKKLVDVIEAVFTVLGILGIVVDPTTQGIKDSKQALSYDKPM